MNQDLTLLLHALENIPIGVFVLDAAGNYVYVNPAYCRTVNKSEKFFEGMSIPKLKELGYLTANVWEQVIESRKPVVSVISITDEQSNCMYDTLTIGTPLFGENKEIEYIVYRQDTINDLTENLQKGILNKLLFGSHVPHSITVDDDLIAESPQMRQIVSMLTAVSQMDVSILIIGPSGTGKEVLAKRIHNVSARSKGPLITINCAAIPENLLESELFGYERGAFTGAAREGKPGLIESAAGGTLFLDEINSMPLSIQTKLLRVLETKQVARLGSLKSRDINFRLVCAANEDLQTLVEQKRFRSDLFYRINVVSVSIPPLKERKEDILPLALHFMDQFSKKYGRVKVLSESAMDWLQHYSWPGNVRELRNMIERAIVISPPTEWEISDLSVNYGDSEHNPIQSTAANIVSPIPEYGSSFSLHQYLDHCEETIFRSLLDQHKSPKQMAEILKVNLSNVYRKLQKFDLSQKQ